MSLVLYLKFSKLHVSENKANAHACNGVSYCIALCNPRRKSRIVALCPLWGVGRAFIGNRHAEPQVDRRFDSRLFCFLQNRRDFFLNKGNCKATILKRNQLMHMPIFIASILYRNSTYRKLDDKGHVIEEIPFVNGKIHGLRKKFHSGNIAIMTPYDMGVINGIEVRFGYDVKWSFVLGNGFNYDKLKQEIPYINGEITGTIKNYWNYSISSWQDSSEEEVHLIECNEVKKGKLDGESIYIETRFVKCHTPFWKIGRRYQNGICTQHYVYIEDNSINNAWKQTVIYLESIPTEYIQSYYCDGTVKTNINLKKNIWTTYYPSGKIKTKCAIKQNGKSIIERFYETGELYSTGTLYRRICGKKDYKIRFEHSINPFMQEDVCYFAKNGVKLDVNSEQYRIDIKLYDSGIVESECPIIKGKKEGMEITYNERGFLASETTFINGKQTGRAYSYYGPVDEENLELAPYCGIEAIDQESFLAHKFLYENGTLKQTTCYEPIGSIKEEILHTDTPQKNDKWNGPAKAFFPDGTLKAKYTYKDNELEGPYIQYYHSGNKLREAFFKQGCREGITIEYFDSKDSRKMVETTYKNDLPDGQKKLFSFDGENILIHVYREGQLVQIHNKVSKKDNSDVWIIADINDIKHNMFGGRFEYSKVSVVKEDGTIEKEYDNLDVHRSMGHLNTNYSVDLKHDEEYALYTSSLLKDGQIILSGEWMDYSLQDVFE